MDLFCRWCAVVYASLGEDGPDPCPKCHGSGSWWPFKVMASDARFLRGIKISVD